MDRLLAPQIQAAKKRNDHLALYDSRTLEII